MKIAGITAEYNPLHNGHVYHIEETRKKSGCDAIVVALSGDFVQRGEPAILDKWRRAEHALKAGADLVVEIPTLFCLGNASQYASASVRILESLGCDEISFGSGCGDIELLSKVVDFLTDNRESVSSYISSKIKEGKSYPAARAEAYREMRRGMVDCEALERELAVLREPNDILALEYLANMHDSRPLVIKRRGTYHEDNEGEGPGFRGAESIRTMIRRDGAGTCELCRCLPVYVAETFESDRPVFADDCFDILKYAIMSTDADAIDKCPSGGEGLGNLLKSAVSEAESYDDLVLRVKSKRYTYTRISRLCMQLVIGINRDESALDGPGYIRVLGHSGKGRELLAEIRTAAKDAGDVTSMLPVITNINKEAVKLDKAALDQLELDIHASEIYSLISRNAGPERAEHRMRPAMV